MLNFFWQYNFFFSYNAICFKLFSPFLKVDFLNSYYHFQEEVILLDVNRKKVERSKNQ